MVIYAPPTTLLMLIIEHVMNNSPISINYMFFGCPSLNPYLTTNHSPTCKCPHFGGVGLTLLYLIPDCLSKHLNIVGGSRWELKKVLNESWFVVLG